MDSNSWKIRRAQLEELGKLMELYAQAREFMAAHGNPGQWGTTYPEESLVRRDVEQGNCFVCVAEGRIAAVFYYHLGEDETYQVIEKGHWLNDQPYGVVHRITSDGRTKGMASYCLAWALGQCRNMKIDTHRDNVVMQNLLKKNGFSYCGIIHVEDGSERLAYQKVITPC